MPTHPAILKGMRPISAIASKQNWLSKLAERVIGRKRASGMTRFVINGWWNREFEFCDSPENKLKLRSARSAMQSTRPCKRLTGNDRFHSNRIASDASSRQLAGCVGNRVSPHPPAPLPGVPGRGEPRDIVSRARSTEMKKDTFVVRPPNTWRNEMWVKLRHPCPSRGSGIGSKSETPPQP